jgi:hypothetical protein
MGVRIDQVELQVKHNGDRVTHCQSEINTMRLIGNAVTIALVAVMLYLFFWLDNKADDKFANLMSDIRTSNETVHTTISEMKVEMVKMNHAISSLKEDHEKRFGQKK